MQLALQATHSNGCRPFINLVVFHTSAFLLYCICPMSPNVVGEPRLLRRLDAVFDCFCVMLFSMVCRACLSAGCLYWVFKDGEKQNPDTPSIRAKAPWHTMYGILSISECVRPRPRRAGIAPQFLVLCILFWLTSLC